MPGPELKKHDNGIYYVHWTDGRRSKRVSMGATEMDGPKGAKARLGAWLLMEQEAPAPDVVFIVADLWDVYDKKHAVAAKGTAAANWKNLQPHFGLLQPHTITQDTVDQYERKRAAGKIGRPSVGSTVRRELGALRACLNWCADSKRKLISKDAIPDFDLPADGDPRDTWLSIEEIQRLLSTAGELRRGERLSRGERFLWLAIETAARKQAILDLTWDRVDFVTKVIHYDVPGRRKTKKRRASVPISKALLPILERAHREREGSLVLDNRADVWTTVQLIAGAAGFGPPQPKRGRGDKPAATGVSPNVLRHTAATHMARRGVALWIIAKILGNSVAMVEKVYAKHCPDHLRAGVEAISSGALEAAE